MATPVNPGGGNSGHSERLLAEYEHAQEIAHHSDTIIYEVGAIIWSGNALLLGFILEAPREFGIQLVVVVLSVLGILTSFFVTRTQSLSKIGQHIAFGICRKIEEDIPLTYKVHTEIDAVYPKGAAQRWIKGITAAFIVVWLVVLIRAACLVWKLRCNI